MGLRQCGEVGPRKRRWPRVGRWFDRKAAALALAVSVIPYCALGGEVSFAMASGMNIYAIAIASDADGDHVLAWRKFQTGGAHFVLARMFDRFGNPVSGEFQVASYPAGFREGLDIAMDGDGDFTITWDVDGVDGSGSGVQARRYAASGAPLGSTFQVNTTTLGDQVQPRVAMDLQGNVAMVWASSGIYAQAYNFKGQPVGSEFRVDEPGPFSRSDPDVAMSAAGESVIVWETSTGGFANSVMGRQFSAAGQPAGPSFLIGSGWGVLFPRLAINSAGGFVVVWRSSAETYARLYNPDSTPTGDPFLVHRADPFGMVQVVQPANVVMDVRGNFGVIGYGYDSAIGQTVHHRRYFASGAPDGPVLLFPSGGPFPALAGDDTGNMIAAWKDGPGILGCRLDGPGDTAGPTVTSVSFGHNQFASGARLQDSVNELILTFSEELENGPDGVPVIANPGYWILREGGTEIPGGVDDVSFAWNAASRKYEGVIRFDGNGELEGAPPLHDGNFTLTLRDGIADLFGNALDGDLDGVPGGEHAIEFSVSGPLGRWFWRNPLPNGMPLRGIGYGKGRLVAVGDGGTILTSSDGHQWVARDSGTTEDLWDVSQAAGTFVAVGGRYPDTGVLLTSVDAIHWETRYTDSLAWLARVAHDGNRFVAVGTNGRMLTSEDAVNWVPVDAAESLDHFRTVVRLNGRFYAGGYSRETGSGMHSVLLTSENGLDWERLTIPEIYWFGPRDFAYGNGRYVGVGTGTFFPNTVLTSLDGFTWSTNWANIFPDSVRVAYGNDRFVAVGGRVNLMGGSASTSPDGMDWSWRFMGGHGTGDFIFTGLCFDGGEFHAVAGNRLSKIVRSRDGEEWALSGSVTSAHLNGVAFGGGRFVAVGSDGSLLHSPDGVHWRREAPVTTEWLTGVYFAHGQFVAVGRNGTLLTSPDGIHWADRSVSTGANLNAIASLPGGFVAVGDGGVVFSSIDGVEWNPDQLEPSDDLFSISCTEEECIALGRTRHPWEAVAYRYSPTSGWMRDASLSDLRVSSIAFGDGVAVAVDSETGRVFARQDGEAWRLVDWDPDAPVYRARYAGDRFMILGRDGILRSSRDGISWRSFGTPGRGYLSDITYGAGAFVAVGNEGMILQTGPNVEVAPSIVELPSEMNVTEGGLLTLRADVSGTPPLQYQWYKDGEAVTGGNEDHLDVAFASPADAGGYHLVARNGLGTSVSSVVRVDVRPVVRTGQVVGRHVFYNGSAWDHWDPGANAGDDDAIAVDKRALLPGARATFENYTSYPRGINGVMVDIAGWSATPAAIDFSFKAGNGLEPSSWAIAPDPLSITVRPGAGEEGSDRITLIWKDNDLDGVLAANEAVANLWLQVTVKAGPGTGLPQDEVFYFGNAPGEVGNESGDATVDTTDVLGAFNGQTAANGAGITSAFDFNRDRVVDTTDVLFAFNHQTGLGSALQLLDLSSDEDGFSFQPVAVRLPVAGAHGLEVTPAGATVDAIPRGVPLTALRFDASRGVLEVKALGDGVVLQLQSSPDLVPGSWKGVPGRPMVEGLVWNWRVRVPMDDPARFFRAIVLDSPPR